MKTINDWKIAFKNIIEEGRSLDNPFQAAMKSQQQTDKLLNTEFLHIKDQCVEYMMNETLEMLKRRKRMMELGDVLEKLAMSLAEPCDDPTCEACMRQKGQKPQAEKKNDSEIDTNVVEFPGNGTKH